MLLLTVLMPVYNAEKFLAESINSILSQTYSNFEFVILDDGSTDNSLKIIKAYAKEDKRIKILVNNKNQKTAKSRNILLKKATTEFIAWMDADDISLPYWLQTQMDFLKQNSNIDVVSCHLQFFGDRKSIFKKALLDSQIKSAFLLDCAFGTGGSIIKIFDGKNFFKNYYSFLKFLRCLRVSPLIIPLQKHFNSFRICFYIEFQKMFPSNNIGII